MTDIAKRPPSVELPNIRELYEKADWPEDQLFTLEYVDSGEDWAHVLMPGGKPLLSTYRDDARASFIIECCNYWLKHLRGGEARETQRLERKANAVGQRLRTREQP